MFFRRITGLILGLAVIISTLTAYSKDIEWTKVYVPNTTSLNSVAISSDASVIYVSDMFSDGWIHLGGLYKTTDNGNTWIQLNLPSIYTISFLRSSSDGSIVYANTGYGLYKSSDSGNTWSTIDFGDAYSGYVPSDMAISGNGNIVYCLFSGLLLKSSNGGITWTELNPAPEYSATTSDSVGCSADGSRIAISSVSRKIYISGDIGASWSAHEASVGSISVSPSSDVIAGIWNGSGMFFSSDSLESYLLSYFEGSETMPTRLSLSYDGNVVLLGVGNNNYNGILISTDSSNTWERYYIDGFIFDPNYYYNSMGPRVTYSGNKFFFPGRCVAYNEGGSAYSGILLIGEIPKSTYTVTFVEGASGTITGTKVQTVNEGLNCTTVTAVPNTGYHFVNWSGDYNGPANPLTYSNVLGDMTITANFAINTYTVTFDLAGKGTRTGGGELTQTVNYGSGATAPTVIRNVVGWVFIGWDKTFDNITSDMTITAQYAPIYRVTFVEGANGTITGTKIQAVTSGHSCTTVTAVPNTGYHFVNWSGDYTGTTNPLTYSNVLGDMTITANFAHNTATLTVNKTGNGSSGFIGANPLNNATFIPITANAETNNHFVKWTLTSGSATIANPNLPDTEVMLTGGNGSTATVTANFATGKLPVTVNITGLKRTYTGEPCPVTVTTVPAGLEVYITYKGDPNEPINAGSYPVIATVVNDNYAGTKTGTLVIAKVGQTINFPALPTNLIYGDDDYLLKATASSELPVIYTSSNLKVATITPDGKLHIVGAGKSNITAKQIGDNNWKAATAVVKALIIGKKNQTIDFPELDNHSKGDPDFSPGATTDSSLILTYTSSTPAVATIVKGKIHIVGKGSAVITAKQIGNTNWNAASPAMQTLTVD